MIIVDEKNLAPIEDKGGQTSDPGETTDIFPKPVSEQMILLYAIMGVIQAIIAVIVTLSVNRNNIQQLKELDNDKNELTVTHSQRKNIR